MVASQPDWGWSESQDLYVAVLETIKDCWLRPGVLQPTAKQGSKAQTRARYSLYIYVYHYIYIIISIISVRCQKLPMRFHRANWACIWYKVGTLVLAQAQDSGQFTRCVPEVFCKIAKCNQSDACRQLENSKQWESSNVASPTINKAGMSSGAPQVVMHPFNLHYKLLRRSGGTIYGVMSVRTWRRCRRCILTALPRMVVWTSEKVLRALSLKAIATTALCSILWMPQPDH
jgi:hypothetical protein